MGGTWLGMWLRGSCRVVGADLKDRKPPRSREEIKALKKNVRLMPFMMRKDLNVIMISLAEYSAIANVFSLFLRRAASRIVPALAAYLALELDAD